MMATEKRLIDANKLTDAIEWTDWYHVSLQGNLVHGARADIHTPLYKADDIYKAIKDAPTVDAVEVDALRAWLYEMAMNNVGVPVADFAAACEEIISRLDGLRAFAEERGEGE